MTEKRECIRLEAVERRRNKSLRGDTEATLRIGGLGESEES